MRHQAFVALALLVVASAIAIAPALADHPDARVSKTCSDYSNQREAQLNKDTRDGDGDGIYCESLPCPCLKPTSGGGGGGGGGNPPSGGTRCGVERWSVKTLSDGAARRVNFRPKTTTVQALSKLRSPGVGSGTARIRGVETTTYRVKALLSDMKLEDDRDIHLVILDPESRRSMIVEFPDVRCNGARSSGKRTAMRKARAALTKACGLPPSDRFVTLSGKATITGVGFFDLKHGQTGVAPNGIELHPVLRFRTSYCARVVR
jgi:hypothetical protein